MKLQNKFFGTVTIKTFSSFSIHTFPLTFWRLLHGWISKYFCTKINSCFIHFSKKIFEEPLYTHAMEYCLAIKWINSDKGNMYPSQIHCTKYNPDVRAIYSKIPFKWHSWKGKTVGVWSRPVMTRDRDGQFGALRRQWGALEVLEMFYILLLDILTQLFILVKKNSIKRGWILIHVNSI